MTYDELDRLMTGISEAAMELRDKNPDHPLLKFYFEPGLLNPDTKAEFLRLFGEKFKSAKSLKSRDTLRLYRQYLEALRRAVQDTESAR